MHLVIRDLSKSYPNGTQALNGVSLDVPQGMFGLLGPNGAGKSTLMRIVATLQDPDEGSIHLAEDSTGSGKGIDVLRQKAEVRRTLGYLPQSFGFHPNAKAERLLEHFAILKGIALLVCGAGADAVPLVRLATELGWRVTVVDQRAAYARPDRFPGASVRLVGDDEVLEATGAADAAVVMAHHYERDQARVRALLAGGVAYIGVLGPRHRTARMLEELGVSEQDAARLYAPVGLDIGAETPDEIALAIVAEVQGVKAGLRGGHLRERTGGIHEESPAAALETAPVAPSGAR